MNIENLTFLEYVIDYASKNPSESDAIYKLINSFIDLKFGVKKNEDN